MFDYIIGNYEKIMSKWAEIWSQSNHLITTGTQTSVPKGVNYYGR